MFRDADPPDRSTCPPIGRWRRAMGGSAALLDCACGSAAPASSMREVPSRLLALTFDARDPGRLAGFWAGILGRVVVDDLRGALLPGSDTQVGLRFAASGG